MKKNFNRHSKMVVHFMKFRVCSKQYCGNTMAKLCTRASNYRSTHQNSRKEQNLSNQGRNQKRFHEHYLQSDHNRTFDGNRPC